MGVPASRVVASKWFVRVDGHKDYLRQQCGVLSKCLDVKAMLSYYHTGKTKENPHVHFVIEIASAVQKQSFAVRIKSLFEQSILKRTDYSVEPWDGKRDVGAVSYLFHEADAEMVTNVGFTDEEVSIARQANDAVQAVVAINKERASGKLVNRALIEFPPEQHVTRLEILTWMLKQIHKGDAYHPGNYRLKQFVDEVIVKRCRNDEELNEYAYNLENILWRE